MNKILDDLNNTNSLLEINNILSTQNKKNLATIAKELDIPLLSRDKRDDIQKKIIALYKAQRTGEAFRNYIYI